MENVISLLLNFGLQNPQIASILMIIGGFRVFMKPITAFIESVVLATDSKKDDEMLSNIQKNPIYKGFMFALDYLFSIKKPK